MIDATILLTVTCEKEIELFWTETTVLEGFGGKRNFISVKGSLVSVDELIWDADSQRLIISSVQDIWATAGEDPVLTLGLRKKSMLRKGWYQGRPPYKH